MSHSFYLPKRFVNGAGPLMVRGQLQFQSKEMECASLHRCACIGHLDAIRSQRDMFASICYVSTLRYSVLARMCHLSREDPQSSVFRLCMALLWNATKERCDGIHSVAIYVYGLDQV
uniref:Uncharacterized protein n=1 Tax=Moniliophthora roreri TaxID=221103 RepID=A0A0W0EV32_MONRR